MTHFSDMLARCDAAVARLWFLLPRLESDEPVPDISVPDLPDDQLAALIAAINRLAAAIEDAGCPALCAGHFLKQTPSP